MASPVGAGNPGCPVQTTSPVTYSFGTVAKNAVVAMALPYGSWTIATTASGVTTTVTSGYLTAPTNTSAGGVNSATGVVTLDPRRAAP